MVQPQTKKVVVLGGSLGGLFADIVFVRLGCDATILDRTLSGDLVEQGAGISVSTVVPPIYESFRNLTTSGSPIVEFLKGYDTTGTNYSVDLPEDFQFLNQDSTVKTTTTGTIPNAATTWDLMYIILRRPFDGSF